MNGGLPGTRAALWIWGILSALVILSVAVLYAWRGPAGIEAVLRTGHLSNLTVTLASVTVTWLLGGSLLYLLAQGGIDRENLFAIIGFYLVGFVYVGVLRERVDYGDAQHYIRAAQSISAGQPLPPEYVYPPLLATVLGLLVPVGETGMLLALWLSNVVALFIFYGLLLRMLERFGFSPRLAAAAAATLLLVNTPLLRTLLYTQVNLHVLNLIFLGVLLYRRAPLLSALSLALAVHLKVSPVVLVLAFVLERDWRWLLWFLLSVLLTGLLLFAAHGGGPYMDFWRTALVLAEERGVIFRDSSLDGLFAAVAAFLSIQPQITQAAIYVSKIALGLWVLLVMKRAISRKVFYQAGSAATVHNALPPLMVLMTLAAPIVWEHHGVFLILPFLVLLPWLRSPADWLWYFAAWFLEFTLPTFDFFPWSYGRLIAPLIILGLMWQTSEKPRRSPVFRQIAAALERI